MIKLTEVVADAGHYDAEIRAVKVKYKLRNFYINPKFIVSIIDNERLNNTHERKYIVDDLHPEAKFTKATVATGPHGATCYDILGSPEQVLELLLKEK